MISTPVRFQLSILYGFVLQISKENSERCPNFDTNVTRLVSNCQVVRIDYALAITVHLEMLYRCSVWCISLFCIVFFLVTQYVCSVCRRTCQRGIL
jgi:hypothetical protein